MKAAHIAVCMDGHDILLQRKTGTTIGFSGETRFSPKGRDLPSVMAGICHFHYFLERQNEATLLSGFALKMYRLEGQRLRRKPILGQNDSGNFIKPILRKDGMCKAELTSDANAKYGFTISNNTGHQLFPYLFYFNPSTYTINCWYEPDGTRSEPPLNDKGEITVGMGTEQAFTFSLPEGGTSARGFLKLFVSTEYLDLKWIEQTESPLNKSFAADKGRDVLGLEGSREPPLRFTDWASHLVVYTMNL